MANSVRSARQDENVAVSLKVHRPFFFLQIILVSWKLLQRNFRYSLYINCKLNQLTTINISSNLSAT
jgi:hypothetical protein